MDESGTGEATEVAAVVSRLRLFGFVLVSTGGGVDLWRLADLPDVLLPADGSGTDPDAFCERARLQLAPLERAYRLGRRDEAHAAMGRVDEVGDDVDPNEALASPEGRNRLVLDTLDLASRAAGGPFASTRGHENPWGTPWSADEPGLCGCVRCVDVRATAERDAGAPFSQTLGSMGRFIVCETCGNKRCPHATFHGNACTFSNDPGQLGSRFERVPWPSGDPSDGPVL